LPLPTRILLAINLAIQKFWFLSLLVVGGIVFAFLQFINSKAGRYGIILN
jgi:type II secretory pathway component PulF